MKTIITTLLAALMIPMAFANPPVDDVSLRPILIPTVQKIKAGDTKIIALPRFAFVDRMTLEANTGFFCGKDSFTISFDGYSTRSVQGDGGFNGFRTKIIQADVRTRTLEIHNSTDCTIKIKNIQILPRRWGEGQYGGGHGPGPVYLPMSEAAGQVSFLLETFMFLEPLVSDSDRSRYISPLKKVIGKAMAVLNTNPETSQASLEAIKAVLDQLTLNHIFVERLATIEATFEAAQEIQSVESSLTRMIR